MSNSLLPNVINYKDAAQDGLGVNETVDRLLRYAWIAKRTMEVALCWINPTPEWEVKEALSYHTYLAAEHAQSFRVRVSEMRNPMPDMNKSPDPRIDRFFDELLTAVTTSEKLTALYEVLKPAVLDAYQNHFNAANPLADAPTRRILRFLMLEEKDAITWGEATMAAVGCHTEFKAHLQAYLAASGGVEGTAVPPNHLPKSRVTTPFEPDYMPRRDRRFELQENFIFPCYHVARTEGVPLEEKTLALMCKRALEMDVPESMARIIAETKEQPWSFYVDMCRQLWDEARHAMMGSVYFENLGVDWRRDIPLHPGFSIRMNMHMTTLEAHAVLYAIEQGLMPAKSGKKYEWQVTKEANNPLAKLFQDFDWADEVLHVHTGREWGIPRSGLDRREFEALGRQKKEETSAVLDQYADPEKQTNWWPAFVKKVLGQESAFVEFSDNIGGEDVLKVRS
ncbi:hypothetical protein [Candidatus Leptofilum sp.]|uniref:hypothetical protein n=1 Tax=Candidatus Leptofilum sp. TaxID=3241576 RepID=UPI003B591273